MKLCPNPFTNKHKRNALNRIFREFILGNIKWTELMKFYSAMLHFERYLERLNSMVIISK